MCVFNTCCRCTSQCLQRSLVYFATWRLIDTNKDAIECCHIQNNCRRTPRDARLRLSSNSIMSVRNSPQHIVRRKQDCNQRKIKTNNDWWKQNYEAILVKQQKSFGVDKKKIRTVLLKIVIALIEKITSILESNRLINLVSFKIDLSVWETIMPVK